ncbi:UDP-3-O-(3-hydroxymyristoyl)glucosamine N-acyltransferase [Desulfuromonas sp. TF]|uniref:UDP-3-O-(3-hydroxymyristoyl)glucosamine N-acyltransferase n=1 Tax=Desulfuromonas sp. TF TaxID=1232410 RepID=UPI00041D377F|nr:UDP-3-O-(3-hydroxymyristoyl)glucosamine N-acyltransferase [Desulfuromonas sp. TF]
MALLKELAELAGGTVVGDGDLEILRLASIDEAREGDITFISNPKYLAKIEHCRASAIIVSPGIEAPGFSLIVCRNPYLAFAKILTFLMVRRPEPKGVMKGAIVAASATLGEGVTVHPGCVIGENVQVGLGTILYPGVVLYDDAVVGEECTLHAGVVVREQCRIGNRVIIQPSAVIGADGFGFAPDGSRYYKIPQIGIVIIEDDVEIGAATCIDRAALGVTRIKRGTKIDNLVQVAHNVVIGEDSILVSQVGIAGSTEIGNHCTFGGQAATSGHLKIGNNVTIGGRGGVTNHVDDNQFLSGLPAIPHKEWLKATMSFTRLPEMRKELSHMKRQLEELEKLIKEG